MYRVDGGAWMPLSEASAALGGRHVRFHAPAERRFMLTHAADGTPHLLERAPAPHCIEVAYKAKAEGVRAVLLDGRAVHGSEAAQALHYSWRALSGRLERGGGRCKVGGHVLELCDPDALLARYNARLRAGVPIEGGAVAQSRSKAGV